MLMPKKVKYRKKMRGRRGRVGDIPGDHPSPPPQCLDLGPDVKRFNDDLDRRVGNTLRQFRDYFLALSNLHELIDTAR